MIGAGLGRGGGTVHIRETDAASAAVAFLPCSRVSGVSGTID